MSCDWPIGFFDSGLGGVSVLREAAQLLPFENFIYFGDDANAPYGVRNAEEILELALHSTDFLAAKQVKAIVLACNTVTSISIKTMRERYSIPIISIEPAVKPAAEAYSTGTIAVFATPATVHQKRFHALIERLGVRDRVRSIECPELASLIERGDLQAHELRAYIRRCVEQLAGESAVNALVMGCTHYSFASGIIQEEALRVLHGACQVFDGAIGTARQLRRVLAGQGLLRERSEPGHVLFCSSAGREVEARMAHFFRYGGIGAPMESDRREYA